MSVEKYHLSHDEKEFSIIPNTVSQGLAYCLEASGLYSYIFSLPPNWIFYKSHLCSACGIGIKKLNKLLKILVQHGLIELVQIRDAQGKFTHVDMRVHSGKYFKNKDLHSVQPEGQICRAARTVRTVKRTYKENKEKENTNIKKENKSICATNVARPRFDDFWFAYPVKKNKARAREVWLKNKLDLKADEIINDVENRRLNDTAWKNPQYIPHPDRYLKYERWNDEVTLHILKNEKKSGNLLALERGLKAAERLKWKK